MDYKNLGKIIGYILLLLIVLGCIPLCVYGFCYGIGIDFKWKYCLVVISVYLLSRLYPIKLQIKKDD